MIVLKWFTKFLKIWQSALVVAAHHYFLSQTLQSMIAQVAARVIFEKHKSDNLPLPLCLA